LNNPERAERIEASLTRAAFGPERIREILMQLKELCLNYLADKVVLVYLQQVLFFNEKIMDIKYNPIIGSFVNTANDEPVTQAELLQWAAENPEPLDTPKKSNPKMMNELIDSLTVKQTPDTTTVEEGVETIQKTI
jgi:hypothetical protein